MSIQELSSLTYTSTTSVLRLCRKLGFSGFKDFKLQLLRDYDRYAQRGRSVNVNMPFDGRDTDLEVMQKIASLTKDTVTACQTLLSQTVVKDVVGRMLAARNVLGVAVSDSFLRLTDFQNKMLKINVYVELTNLQPEQAFLCTHATPDDLALLVSYSGKTAEVVHDALILKDRGVPSVAITSDAQSPLASLVDCVMPLPNDENSRMANYTLSSQIAIEYALNVLFACIYKTQYYQSRQHLRQSRDMYLDG
jgi:DNA-binding MurR/RpiR family transcriptional regulator